MDSPLHVWTVEGWLYIAVVIDLFSRRVVGWSTTAQLVFDAQVMAIWRRGKLDALPHLLIVAATTSANNSSG